MPQEEHAKSTERSTTSAETYYKDVDKHAFILEVLIPTFLMDLLYGFCLGVVLLSAIHTYSSEEFVVKSYILSKSFLHELIVILFLIFIVSFWNERRKYHLMKKNPYASINNEKLGLQFGKASFLWDRIQSVGLEGERKLIVVFKDDGKRKKGAADLRWLSRKKDFIERLKNNCVTRNIRYEEGEISFSSKAGLFLKYYALGVG